MTKFKTVSRLILILLIISPLLFLFYSKFIEIDPKITLEMDVNSNVNHEYQLYFYDESKVEISEEYSSKIQKKSASSNLSVSIPSKIKGFRFDLGETESEIVVKEISIKTMFDSATLQLGDITRENSNQLERFENSGDMLSIKAIGTDPYIYVEVNDSLKGLLKKEENVTTYLMATLFTLITLVLSLFAYLNRSKIKIVFKDIWQNKNLIYKLSVNDFKTKYTGSYFGVLWAFVQPLMTILVFWFVFEIGFRSGPVEDVPFILWLIAGMVPWFFFAESWANSTNSYLEYNYLVKKIMFKINILPLVKICSAFYVHLFFVTFTLILYLMYNISPSVYWLQLLYYTLCAFLLSYAFSIVTSALIIFFKDLGQLLSLILQVGMWVTPILWKYTMMPESYLWLLKLNPAYYLVEGYRDSLIYKTWFWENFSETFYFWCVIIVISIVGIIINKKLRPHFADVL